MLEHVDNPSGLLQTVDGPPWRTDSCPRPGRRLLTLRLEQWLQRHGMLRPFLRPMRRVGRLARWGARLAEAKELAEDEESGHAVLHAASPPRSARRDRLRGRRLEERIAFWRRAQPVRAPCLSTTPARRLRAADGSLPLGGTWYFACIRRDSTGRGSARRRVATYRISESFAELARDALGGELETLDVSSLRRLPCRSCCARSDPTAVPRLRFCSRTSRVRRCSRPDPSRRRRWHRIYHGRSNDGTTVAVRKRDAFRAT